MSARDLAYLRKHQLLGFGRSLSTRRAIRQHSARRAAACARGSTMLNTIRVSPEPGQFDVSTIPARDGGSAQPRQTRWPSARLETMANEGHRIERQEGPSVWRRGVAKVAEANDAITSVPSLNFILNGRSQAA